MIWATRYGPMRISDNPLSCHHLECWAQYIGVSKSFFWDVQLKVLFRGVGCIAYILFCYFLWCCWALVIQLTYMHTYRLIEICIFAIFWLIAFQILSSPQDIDKEISELKMSVNTRGRLVATEFLKQFIWLLSRVHASFLESPWHSNKPYMRWLWSDTSPCLLSSKMSTYQDIFDWKSILTGDESLSWGFSWKSKHLSNSHENGRVNCISPS